MNEVETLIAVTKVTSAYFENNTSTTNSNLETVAAFFNLLQTEAPLILC